MKTLDRRARLILTGVLVVVALAAIALVRSAADDEALGSVDGHSITRAEVSFHMSQHLRSVQNQLQTQGNGGSAPESGWDWEDEYDGLSARHRLQDAAIDAIVRDKQVFLLAHELGLVDYVDHASFLEAVEAENASRGEAVGRGEIVYGTVEFTPSQYYATVLTDLETQVMRELSATADGALYVSPAEIESRYEQDPGAWGANAVVYRTEQLTLPNPEDSEDRARLRDGLQADLDAGVSLARLAEAHPGATVTQEQIDGSAQVSLRGPERDVLTQLASLEVGGRTTAVEREGRLIVHELTGREVSSDQALRAYASRIREVLVAEKFEDLLDARIDTADIDVDLTILRSIDMEELEQ